MQEILNKESEILSIIQEIGVPFMEALQKEFRADLGWRICAPASIALSRIISARTGVPIVRDGQGEHLELYMGLYIRRLSRDQALLDVLVDSDEQTYIRYYTGDGVAYYIDPIFGMLLQPKQLTNQPIIVEKYPSVELEESLRRQYGLIPFHPRLARLIPQTSFVGLTPEQCSISWNDLMGAVHDFRATMPAFIADSGQLIKTKWHRVSWIIKKFANDWQEDLPTQITGYHDVFGSNKWLSNPKKGSLRIKYIEKKWLGNM